MRTKDLLLLPTVQLGTHWIDAIPRCDMGGRFGDPLFQQDFRGRVRGIRRGDSGRLGKLMSTGWIIVPRPWQTQRSKRLSGVTRTAFFDENNPSFSFFARNDWLESSTVIVSRAMAG